MHFEERELYSFNLILGADQIKVWIKTHCKQYDNCFTSKDVIGRSFVFCFHQLSKFLRLLQLGAHHACVNILHPPDKSHLSNLAEEVCEEVLYLQPVLTGRSLKSHLPSLMGGEAFTKASLPLEHLKRKLGRRGDIKKTS